MPIRETDWKVFKRLWEVALERISQQILDESQIICNKSGETAHQKYLELYKHIYERDNVITRIFDKFSRSSALLSLHQIRSMNLLTDAEVSELSEEAQQATNPHR